MSAAVHDGEPGSGAAGVPSGAVHDEVRKGGPLAFFVMVLGMFMAILDIQIVSASLPQIQAGVSASADEITWVQTAYLVAEVVMIPLSGWLARAMSTRWAFALSSAGFTLMSIACAFAWNVESLIFFRAVQGFVGGAMIPLVFAANFKLFPPEKQLMGTVILGLTATLAPSIGPTLGGYLTELYSWHWLFLINVVPGILVTIAVPLMIDIDRPDWSLFRRIDFVGILLVAACLGSLEFVLDEGPRDDWFDSRLILGLTITSFASALLLYWWERRVADPVIRFEVFRDRNFALGCVLTFVLGMCLYGQSYILPQVLARVRDYNSLQIGQVMYVTGLAMFLTAPLAGRLGKTVDPRMILSVGFPLVAAGLWLNSRMTADVGFDQLFWPQVVRGVGLVLCIVTITAVALGTLSRKLVGDGSGLFNVSRNMGGAVGLALINTNWDGRFDRHYWWLAERLSSTSDIVAARLDATARSLSGALGTGAEGAALGRLARSVSIQANVMAWNDVFLMMSVAVACLVPLVWLMAKPRGAAVAAH